MQLKIILMLLAVLAGMAFYGLWQRLEIQALVGEVKDLTLEVSTSKENEKIAKASLEFQEDQFALSNLKIQALGVKLAESQEQVTYVRKLFNGHDFADLLAKKPGLIEKRMIAASAKALKRLEDATK